MIQTCPGPTAVARAADSLLPGMNFDVLDAGSVGDGGCADNFTGGELPEAECVGFLDAGYGRWLEDGDRDDEVGGQDDVGFVVDGEPVRTELLAEDVERSVDIFGPLVDDIEVGVCLDEAARRSPDSGSHVGDEKATIGLCADLIRDRRQQYAV
jgi:hypothetical protein